MKRQAADRRAARRNHCPGSLRLWPGLVLVGEAGEHPSDVGQRLALRHIAGCEEAEGDLGCVPDGAGVFDLRAVLYASAVLLYREAGQGHVRAVADLQQQRLERLARQWAWRWSTSQAG
jgi:hypothetical protein